MLLQFLREELSAGAHTISAEQFRFAFDSRPLDAAVMKKVIAEGASKCAYLYGFTDYPHGKSLRR